MSNEIMIVISDLWLAGAALLHCRRGITRPNSSIVSGRSISINSSIARFLCAARSCNCLATSLSPLIAPAYSLSTDDAAHPTAGRPRPGCVRDSTGSARQLDRLEVASDGRAMRLSTSSFCSAPATR